MPRISKKAKIAFVTTGVIFSIITIVGLYFGQQYKDAFKDSLPQKVNNATNGLYNLSFSKIRVNLLTRSITIKDIVLSIDSNRYKQLKADSALPNNCFNVIIPKAQASGIHLNTLSTEFDCKEILVDQPRVSIHKNKKDFCKNYSKKISEQGYHLSTNLFYISSGKIAYTFNTKKGTRQAKMANVNIKLDDWDTYNKSNTSNFLLSENGNIHIGKTTFSGSQMDYIFSVKDLNFNSGNSKLNAKDLKIQLATTPKEFYQKWNVQKEIYDLNIPTIEINNINWITLFQKQKLFASTIYFNHTTLNILFNRQLAPNPKSKMGNYPNQLLMKLKLPIYVKDIRMNNGSITYTEISNRSGKKGSIYFTRLDGRIDNITNMDSLVDSNDKCTINVNGKLNQFTDISAAFELKLNDKKGSFKLNTTLEGLQGHQISSQTEIFTLIAIKSMNMQRLSMQLVGNENYAKSKFEMLYHNLSIKIMKEKTDKKKEKRKKGFMTFIANNMMLHSNNPSRGSQRPRKVNTYIKRNPHKSFFNIIWRNIHQGVQETTIRDMNVIRWMRKLDKKDDQKKSGS